MGKERIKSISAEIQCLLCLEEFEKGDEVIFLPCHDATNPHMGSESKTIIHGLDSAHFLHSECLLSHLKLKHRCPVCQVPVRKEIFVNFRGADFGLYRKYNSLQSS